MVAARAIIGATPEHRGTGYGPVVRWPDPPGGPVSTKPARLKEMSPAVQLVDPHRPAGSPGPLVIELIELKGALARAQGLLGQSDLPPGYGVRLRTRQVHTIGMRFSIDTVYLSKSGLVLRVATMRPGRIGPVVLKARWIVELRAGEAERLGVVPGMTLEAVDR